MSHHSHLPVSQTPKTSCYKMTNGLRSAGKTISLDDMGFNPEEDELSLELFTSILGKSINQKRTASLIYRSKASDGNEDGQILPKVITFPYSRHSSYAELCDLVKAFNPKDIYPCTVDEEGWHEGMSTYQKQVRCLV